MDPISKAVIGGYFVVMGLVMVLFRRDVKKFYDDLFGGRLASILPLMLLGRPVVILIPVLGALSIIGGGLVLLLAMSE